MAIRSAIPADGSFIADLKLYYSAEDLPDDPNFNEAALKVIAFDPATGNWKVTRRRLISRQERDRAHQRADANVFIGSLRPFAHRTLNFPFSEAWTILRRGSISASLGPTSATLTARAFTPTGRLYNDQGVVNPLNITSACAANALGLASDLFKFNLPVDGGWIQTQADKNFIAGYQMLGKDNRLMCWDCPRFMLAHSC